MGSYGDEWLQCALCRRPGKCLLDLPADVAQLIDVDGVGPLCNPCYDRGPPHYAYLERLLKPKLGIANAELVESIANFAYKVCADYRLL